MDSIPSVDGLVVGGDFNGNKGHEMGMGKFDVKDTNVEQQMVVDFVKRMEMVAVKT